MLSLVSRLLRSLFGRNKAEPQDPYSYVGAPLRRGPKRPAGSVALAEPEPPTRLNAIGR